MFVQILQGFPVFDQIEKNTNGIGEIMGLSDASRAC